MNLHLSRLAFLLLLTLPLASYPEENHQRQVEKASNTFDHYFSTGNADGMASLLLEDSEEMSAGGAWVSRENIVNANLKLRERRPGITLVTNPESIEIGPENWGVAAERGRWIERWENNGEQNEITGTYLAMWRYKDGTWLRKMLLLIPVECSGPYCSAD